MRRKRGRRERWERRRRKQKKRRGNSIKMLMTTPSNAMMKSFLDVTKTMNLKANAKMTTDVFPNLTVTVMLSTQMTLKIVTT